MSRFKEAHRLSNIERRLYSVCEREKQTTSMHGLVVDRRFEEVIGTSVLNISKRKLSCVWGRSRIPRRRQHIACKNGLLNGNISIPASLAALIVWMGNANMLTENLILTKWSPWSILTRLDCNACSIQCWPLYTTGDNCWDPSNDEITITYVRP